MPEGTQWNRPEGGMCMWLELPPGFDASELLIHVKERGVLFAPGRYFYVQSPLPNTLRLGFASLDEKQIARGVATLAEMRSEEHTSELQSRLHLVCRLLLEKKNITNRDLHNAAGAADFVALGDA